MASTSIASSSVRSPYRFSSLSTSSLSRYPTNRPSRFTHHLPETLFLDPQKKYVIRLLSLCLSTASIKGETRPSYIKLHLAQLDANAFASPKQQRCLCHLVLPPATSAPDQSHITVDWLEIKNPTPRVIEPTIGRLTELTFVLTDEKDQELIIEATDSTHPTVLNSVIEEMAAMDRFTLTMHSSASKHFFPANKDSDFRMYYGSPVVKDLDWEVALHSIVVPAGMGLTGERYTYEVVQKDGQKTVGIIPNKNRITAKQVVEKLQHELRKHGVYITRMGRFDYEVTFEEPDSRQDHHAEELRFDSSLCLLLGVSQLDRDGMTYHALPDSRWQRCFPKGAFYDPDRFTTFNEQLVLYADMVQSSIIGDERAPLIDILSSAKLGLAGEDRTSDTLYAVQQPTFRPIAKANIREIRVRLTDIRGKEIEFDYAREADPNIQMYFVFVFQKIKE